MSLTYNCHSKHSFCQMIFTVASPSSPPRASLKVDKPLPRKVDLHCGSQPAHLEPPQRHLAGNWISSIAVNHVTELFRGYLQLNLSPIFRGKKNTKVVNDPTKKMFRLPQQITPPKFNIVPENRESQKETHLPTIHFQGLC